MQQKHDGVYLLGQFAMTRSGAWMFVSGDECALFEAPEYDEGETAPVDIATDVINRTGLKLRYVLISHPHRDHVDSIGEYRRAFPDATFVAHKTASFIINKACTGELLENSDLWMSLPSSDEQFDILYDDSIKLQLGSEIIHQLFTPKHSPGDTMTYFNNVLFSGDWWLFEGDPGNCREVQVVANESIQKLYSYLQSNGLYVKHVFPSHANNMLYNVDIGEILWRTLVPADVPHAPLCPDRGRAAGM